jgi:hypothetical protein
MKIAINLATWRYSIDITPILCYHCNQSVSFRGSYAGTLILSCLSSFGEYIGFVTDIPFCEGAFITCFQHFLILS